MNIVISGNCQIAAIGATVASLLPGATIDVVQIDSSADLVKRETFAPQLRAADLWLVTQGQDAPLTRMREVADADRLRIFKVPRFIFRAFHPDQCNVNLAGVKGAPLGHLSSIVGWCFRNRVEPEDALGCFNESIFEALGFHDRWELSKQDLAARFAVSDLRDDYRTFIRRVQRFGCFMHTVNHPHAHVLVMLGKLVAMRLGADREAWDRALELPDGLDDFKWPVYPSIAARLSLQGSFNFVMNGRPVALDEFVRAQYERLRAFCPDPSQLVFHPDGVDPPRLDRVLGAHLGVRP